ncbi:MmcQ/YjbR family DNA-binding protein [Motiliproteus sediminis]|uniref:MmcQ/YjbR family DNA-binding protein n=1 Tax=Motiliproteus sediminis TaxID=1468178 RepID=UPI001AEFD3C4|nr:MmcQ/YjbR family DNA-binding protein [Motiliproteus sediminis]
MTREQFNDFCRALPATTWVVQWGGCDVWKIGGKVFAIGSTGKTGNPAYSFKTSELNFHFLSAKEGYQPAPYLASRGFSWIQQYNAPQADDDLCYYLRESYRIVSLGLTKKLQRQLGLNQQPHLRAGKG